MNKIMKKGINVLNRSKYVLFFIFSLFYTSELFAQIEYDVWETVETVDEFGDPTEDSVLRFFTRGTFSNSATLGDDMTVKLLDYGDDMELYIYEYDSTVASFGFKIGYGEISIKRANGDVETYGAYSMESTTLYFRDKKKFGRKFIKLIRESQGEVLKVVVKEKNFSEYGSSKYSFTLITQ
jgi:hypothetical protein